MLHSILKHNLMIHHPKVLVDAFNKDLFHGVYGLIFPSTSGSFQAIECSSFHSNFFADIHHLKAEKYIHLVRWGGKGHKTFGYFYL